MIVTAPQLRHRTAVTSRVYLHDVEQTIQERLSNLLINDAIETAQTEHVIYFLLASYVETFGFYDSPRSSLPPNVKRLPIVGTCDVTERLRALRETLDSNVQESSDVRALIQEAVDIFDTASQRLRILEEAVRMDMRGVSGSVGG